VHEAVMDDVIINVDLPEPTMIGASATMTVAMLLTRRKRKAFQSLS
jgi:hypothetical protein